MHTIDCPRLVCAGVRECQPTTHTHTQQHLCPTFLFWEETEAYSEAQTLALGKCISPFNVAISIFLVWL